MTMTRASAVRTGQTYFAARTNTIFWCVYTICTWCVRERGSQGFPQGGFWPRQLVGESSHNSSGKYLRKSALIVRFGADFSCHIQAEMSKWASEYRLQVIRSALRKDIWE